MHVVIIMQYFHDISKASKARVAKVNSRVILVSESARCTRDENRHMAQVEALHAPRLVVDLTDDLSVDVDRREGHQSDVEFEGHGEEGRDMFEVVLVVAVPAQVFSVVPHRFAEVLGRRDFVLAKTA